MTKMIPGTIAATAFLAPALFALAAEGGKMTLEVKSVLK
jgi:hypothetical protein